MKGWEREERCVTLGNNSLQYSSQLRSCFRESNSSSATPCSSYTARRSASLSTAYAFPRVCEKQQTVNFTQLPPGCIQVLKERREMGTQRHGSLFLVAGRGLTISHLNCLYMSQTMNWSFLLCKFVRRKKVKLPVWALKPSKYKTTGIIFSQSFGWKENHFKMNSEVPLKGWNIESRECCKTKS